MANVIKLQMPTVVARYCPHCHYEVSTKKVKQLKSPQCPACKAVPVSDYRPIYKPAAGAVREWRNHIRHSS